LLPENYNTSTDSFPVVYLLHGLGDNQTSWYKYGLIKYYSDKYAAENVPMIFVMPQGFNSYFVNRYNGSLEYMDFFTTEFLSQIDSLYRTKNDKTQRAVMGYSMGGYGALILPCMNPDLFSISVPLSMSFRTDDQYMAEPESVFDYQWGSIFGGSGTQGISRLTDYFKELSPFHFFKDGDLSRFDGLKILIDCGDDEESLSVTNNSLHCLMRENGIKHEFRVRNGAHSWEYWHSSLPEALSFISASFQGLDYPEGPEDIEIGDYAPVENIKELAISGTALQAGILLPPLYDELTGNYPVIYLIHDFANGERENEKQKLFALAFNSMTNSKLSKSLLVEIPCEKSEITEEKMKSIIEQVESTYKTRKDNKGRMLMGNGVGGGLAAAIAFSDTVTYGSCCLFNAVLPDESLSGGSNMFYYLDSSDEGQSYLGYQRLYFNLRDNGSKYEYRVRNGDDSFLSFLKGFSNSLSVLKTKLPINT
jgi:S-formylglutathione hydrolase FrmB